MALIERLPEALLASFNMFWEVLWPLILGFLLSAVVQSLVPHKSLSKLLGKNSPKNLFLATAIGAASSSCSYAAVALARSIFAKGASFTNAMIFEIASTNLVIELGIILIVLMGWQFMAAEFLGGILMVIIIALAMRLTLSKKLESLALLHAHKNIAGKMEGHAQMDMSISTDKPFIGRLISKEGLTAISHYFVMDWAAIWTDLVLGFLIAGLLAVFVPQSFWQAFFLTDSPTLAKIEGPLIGPLVAMLSFVCSVGNIPLAAVLWRGGISFGGVVSFIFADLIVVPILDIYRKYYGLKVMIYILGAFYIAMALAGYITEILFETLGIVPANRQTVVVNQTITINYTTFLNLIFLVFAVGLVIRFIRTNGFHMLKMMSASQDQHTNHHHHQ